MAFPDKVIAHGIEIYDFLPQRPPMVMIDTLISCQDKTTITSLNILPDNVFVKDGYLAEPGIIENIAQTAAAGVGYMYKNNSSEKEVPIGVIGAIKDLKIYFLPKTGETIRTEVVVLYEVMNASVIYGKVYSDNKIIAECEMKIFLTDSQNK
jgi:predicted hotdog family 3-hydroxylacyl-ACP dehydratase